MRQCAVKIDFVRQCVVKIDFVRQCPVVCTTACGENRFCATVYIRLCNRLR